MWERVHASLARSCAPIASLVSPPYYSMRKLGLQAPAARLTSKMLEPSCYSFSDTKSMACAFSRWLLSVWLEFWTSNDYSRNLKKNTTCMGIIRTYVSIHRCQLMLVRYNPHVDVPYSFWKFDFSSRICLEFFWILVCKLYIYIYTHMYVYMCIYKHIHVYLCVCIYIHIYKCIYILHICMYIYIRIHTCIHTYIYMYIHIDG